MPLGAWRQFEVVLRLAALPFRGGSKPCQKAAPLDLFVFTEVLNIMPSRCSAFPARVFLPTLSLLLCVLARSASAQEPQPLSISKQELQQIVASRACDPGRWPKARETFLVKPEVGTVGQTRLTISPYQQGIAQNYYQTAIERLGKFFDISEPNSAGLTTVRIVGDPRLLCGEDGHFITIVYSWVTLNIDSSISTRRGSADPVCVVGARFLATGGAKYVNIDPSSTFQYEPSNAEGKILQRIPGAVGENQEIAVFRRLSNDEVQVTLSYYSKTAGRNISSEPVWLKYCVDHLPKAPSANDTSGASSIERRGFFWGVGAQGGLGVINDSNAPTAAGVLLGASLRLGYFFSPLLGLFLEPRFTMTGRDGLFGYSAAGSAVLQLNLARYFLIALGPSFGTIGTYLPIPRSTGPDWAVGSTLRIGSDFMLARRPNERGPRAFSVRLDIHPQYYSSGGLLTSIALMLGYENY